MAYAKKRTGARGVRWTAVYLAPDGSERSAGTYLTQTEALAAANIKAVDVGRSTWLDPANAQVSFKAFALGWAERRDWSPTTRAGNMSRLEQHLFPALGHKTLQQAATYTTLVEAYAKIASTESAKTGRRPSQKTMREIMLLVGQVMDEAVRAGRLQMHAAHTVSKPELVKDSLDALTPGQVEDILVSLSPEEQPLAETILETGGRWGEITGLRAGDLVGSRLRIARTVLTVTKSSAATELGKMTRKEREGQPWPDTQYLLSEYPKGRRRRTITCSPVLVALLTARIEALDLDPHDFLFLRPNGLPQDRKTWSSKHWRRAVTTAGLNHLPRVWVHDLRSAHASWLLANGASLGDVMRRLGWSQLETVKRYDRPLPDAEDRMVQAFSSMRAQART
jgi:integrase